MKGLTKTAHEHPGDAKHGDAKCRHCGKLLVFWVFTDQSIVRGRSWNGAFGWWLCRGVNGECDQARTAEILETRNEARDKLLGRVSA